MQDGVDLVWAGVTTGRFDATPLAGAWSLAEGARAQLALLERQRAAGETQAGWKVGMTSGASRDALGVGVRPFGYLLESRVYTSPAQIEFARIHRPGLETELCFRVGQSISGEHVTPDDARSAMASVAAAFEINEERIEGTADDAVRVADNLRQWGIVVGTEVAPVPSLDWDTLVSTIALDGTELQSVRAKGHIDDHFQSIAALARALSRVGLGLEAGQLIITGAYTRQEVRRPGFYEGTFGALGGITLRFT